MDKLTFNNGTFAGKTIRTTTDGYASIYDIMRVAGVGNDPSTAWKDLKPKFHDPQVTSGTSDSRQTAVKMFKFSGRGQRDTPVINGPGVVRLLFLLPGANARQFVAESAEILVRHLGGDETLVGQIRHNREIAQQNPDSAQAFMAANIPRDVSTAVTCEMTKLEIEERRARLVRYEKETTRLDEENKILKLEVLEKYCLYTSNNVHDPRIKEQIFNEVNNRE